MSLGQQMKTRRKELGLSRADLADRLGVSLSAISNYENGISSPKEEILLRLFTALEVEPNYLFRDSYAGTDTLSSGEAALIERYRALSATGKRAVSALLDAAEEHRGSRKIISMPEKRPVRHIPLFASPAAVGYAAPALGEDYALISAESAPEEAQFAVRVGGDFMAPHIPDGSVVYVGRQPLQNGDVGIFRLGGSTFCKQYYRDATGTVYLFSLNRKYAGDDAVLHAEDAHTLICFGRVLLGKPFPLPGEART